MSAATLQRRINRAIHRAGIDATFHQLRHRYGTLAYQATCDLVAVGRQMDHLARHDRDLCRRIRRCGRRDRRGRGALDTCDTPTS